MPTNRTISWTGLAGDTLWSTGGNWDLGAVPGNDPNFLDIAAFSSGTTVSGAGTAAYVLINGDSIFNGTFSATGLPNNFTALEVDGGTAVFSGPGTNLTTAADVLVGFLPPAPGAGTATLNIANGANATFNTTAAPAVEASIYIGNSQNGAMNILGSGTQVTTDSGIVAGVNAGVNGALHVGDHAQLNIGFSAASGFGVYVGSSGNGSILIDGGAKVSGAGFANIGTISGSSGSVTVDGAGSDWHQTGTIAVGFFAGTTGAIGVHNGAAVDTDGSVRIGGGGTVTVDGGSSLTATGNSGAGGRITVDNAARINLGAGSVINATGTHFNQSFQGLQVAAGGSVLGEGTINATFVQNSGSIEANTSGHAGTLFLDSLAGPVTALSGLGLLKISGDATLEISGGADASQTVQFANTADSPLLHEILQIDGATSAFTAAISGFATGDVIDLASVGGAQSYSLDTVLDVLTVRDAAGSALASVNFIGDYSANTFTFSADGHGGTAITLDNQIVAAANQRTVSGTAGNDHIVIGATNIVVNAGAGNDTITITPSASPQFHFINGGAGADTLDLSQATSAVRVDLSEGIATGNQIGFAIVSGIENIIGGAGNDILTGGNAANVLDGRSGNDTIRGNGGNDTIIGGAGNDRLTGGGGNDTFVFRAGFGHDTVTDFHIGTAASHDVLDLRGLGFATVQDVLSHTDAGASAIVHAGIDDITLQGVTRAQLQSHAFDILI